MSTTNKARAAGQGEAMPARIPTSEDCPAVARLSVLLDEVFSLAYRCDRMCYHFSGQTVGGDTEAAEILVDVMRDDMRRIGWMVEKAQLILTSGGVTAEAAFEWLLPPSWGAIAEREEAARKAADDERGS
ncbi:MAG: hypothetical protein RL722_2281 [Pseudomonadota bacterium]|jgi:hypothetical protein